MFLTTAKQLNVVDIITAKNVFACLPIALIFLLLSRLNVTSQLGKNYTKHSSELVTKNT